MKPLDAADADAAQRVAVIGVAQGQVASSSPAADRAAAASIGRPFSSATSTAVAPSSEKKTCSKPGGRDVDQPLGQLDRRRVRRAQRA